MAPLSGEAKRKYQHSYMGKYMAQYRAEGRDPSRVTSRMRDDPFVGVDGEGRNVSATNHAYFLLRVGGQSIFPPGGRVRLTTEQCLSLLDTQRRDAIHIIYYGNYDFTKILTDVDSPSLAKLINPALRRRKEGNGRTYPIVWRGYEIDMLAGRMLSIRKRIDSYVDDDGKTRWNKTPEMKVFDVGPFFQCPFIDAIKKWKIGDKDEWESIEAGKRARARFAEYSDEWVDEYNALEIKLLQELMEKFRSACLSPTVNLVPANWFGPGQLAEAMFRKYQVPRTKDVPILSDERYVELLRFARAAYYGGRTEAMAIGNTARPVKQYDINSAYPYAMLTVPCLIHGEWTYREYAEGATTADIDGDLALCYGTFSPNEYRTLWFGLPWRRSDGSILYPGWGRGWYWAHEINASIHQNFSVDSAWIYRRRCVCQPLSFVREVYAERKALGKNDAGTVLKLALNSLYGKSVQSVGNPRYSNPIWGSYITSICRTMIQDFIHGSKWCSRHPENITLSDPETARILKKHPSWIKHIRCGVDILMVATDGVATWNLDRDDIQLGEQLGEWSVETHDSGMFIVQPGVYYRGNQKPPKARGVSISELAAKEYEFREGFANILRTGRMASGNVNVPDRLFVGIRLALARHNFGALGTFEEREKSLSFDWSSKRYPDAPYIADNPIGYYETQPWLYFPEKGEPAAETTPYKKSLGIIEEIEQMERADGPDWLPRVNDQGE